VHGAGHLQIDRQGDLLLQTAARTLRQARPVAYQQVGGQRRPVTARYILRTGHEVGGAVGAYDHMCVGIDPTRVPVRVAYFRGVDAPGDNIGIYSGVAQAGYTNGAPKVATVYCPNQKRKGISNTPVPIARIYSSLIATACYH